MKVRHHIIIVLISLLVACRREQPTVWSPTLRAPIAYGSLGITNVLDNAYLMADENQLLHLRIERNLSDFNIDSLVEIPDTTIHKSLILPFTGGPFVLPAGTEFYDQQQNNTIQTQGAQLKEVVLRSGFLHYTFTSYVNGALTCTCQLPGATIADTPIVLSANTAPTTNDLTPSQSTGTIDLSNCHIDFSGINGNGFNQLVSLIQIQVANDAAASAQVFGNDSVIVDLRFEDALVHYGRGYFGQHQYVLNESILLGDALQLPEGQINIDDATLELLFKNYVGVDLQLNLESLNGIQANQSIALTHPPLFDWLNFTRASDWNGTVTPTTSSFSLNSNNSNLNTFIGSLPHEIQLSGEINVNPLGNIGLNNDFIYTDQTIEVWAALDIPLNLATSGLQLQDTILLTNAAIDLVAEGQLKLVLDNYYPCSVLVNVQLVNAGQEFILIENSSLEAVDYNIPNQAVRSVFDIPVTQTLIENLRSGAKIQIAIELATGGYPQLQPFYQHQRIDYQFIANGSVELEYE